jgi:hypothetical protein
MGLGGRFEAPSQASRVDQSGAILAPETTLVGGRVDLGPHRLLVKQFDVLA